MEIRHGKALSLWDNWYFSTHVFFQFAEVLENRQWDGVESICYVAIN